MKQKPLFRCIIPGAPQGKERPRVVRRQGRSRAITPAKTAAWESFASLLFRQAAPRHHSTIMVAVVLRVLAIKPRPQRLSRKKDPDGRIWRISKPDGDNVLKIVADALVLARIIRDDALICEWCCRSLYGEKGEAGSVQVELHKAGELTG